MFSASYSCSQGFRSGSALFLEAGSGSTLVWKLDPDPHLSQNLGAFSKRSHEGPWTLKIEARRLKMDASGRSVGQWSQIRITLMRSKIRIRIEVNIWIRIHIKAMRIRNSDCSACIRTVLSASCSCFTYIYSFCVFHLYSCLTFIHAVFSAS